MTCIVAIVDEKGIACFAGDSLCVSVPTSYHAKGSQVVRRETKVWARDGMIFGGNGDVRMLQLLRYSLVIPEYTVGRDKVQYLVTQFIPALQECFEKAKFPDDSIEGGFMLSIEKELFTIASNFGVYTPTDPYESVGTAKAVALGSLHTTEQLQIPPLQRLKLALLATEHHTCVTSQPFHYITSEMEQPEILP